MPIHAVDHPASYTNFSELSHCLTPRDVIIAMGGATLLAAVVGGLRSESLKFSDSTVWIVLGALIIAGKWNQELLLIPSYALVFLGCYVAFFSLGRVWAWRAVVATISVTALPCVLILKDCWTKYVAQLALNPATRPSLEFFRDFPANFPGSNPSCDAKWLTAFPPLTLAMFMGHNRRWAKPLLILIGVLQVLALLVGARRSAYLSMLALIPGSLIFFNSKRLRKAVILIMCALAFVATAMVLNHRTIQLARTLPGGSVGHELSYMAAWDMFREHPIVGVGLGNYFAQYQVWVWSHLPGETDNNAVDCPTPFNDFLAMLSEGGLALTVLCLGVVLQLWLVVRHVPGQQDSWALAIHHTGVHCSDIGACAQHGCRTWYLCETAVAYTQCRAH